MKAKLRTRNLRRRIRKARAAAFFRGALPGLSAEECARLLALLQS